MAIRQLKETRRSLKHIIENDSHSQLFLPNYEKLILHSKEYAMLVVRNIEIAKAMGTNGRPLIFLAVENHEAVARKALSNPDILKISDYLGITVAHACVIFHKKLSKYVLKRRDDIASIKTSSGLSVGTYAKVNVDELLICGKC